VKAVEKFQSIYFLTYTNRIWLKKRLNWLSWMAIWSMRIQKKGRLEAFLGETLYGYSREESPDLSIMGKIFNNPDEADRQRRLKKFKEELLYPEALLINKDSVPNSYFELQLRIARQRGQGADYDRVGIRTADDFSPEARKKAGETIYRDQKKITRCLG